MYGKVAILALTVSLLCDLLAGWYFSDRTIVNPTQQFTLFMNVSSMIVALVKFASVATLLAVGTIWLKRSVYARHHH